MTLSISTERAGSGTEYDFFSSVAESHLVGRIVNDRRDTSSPGFPKDKVIVKVLCYQECHRILVLLDVELDGGLLGDKTRCFIPKGDRDGVSQVSREL